MTSAKEKNMKPFFQKKFAHFPPANIRRLSLYIVFVLATLPVLFMSSCAKMSDEPFNFNDVSAVYIDSVFLKQYINSLYNFVPNGYNRLGGSMLDASTDLAVNSVSNSPAFRIGTGAWGATANPDDAWANNYKGIRAVNIFFRDIEPNITSRVIKDPEYRKTIVGQAYFLRALFYGELVKRYGGVPIIEDVYDAADMVNATRSNYDQAIAYIIEQCDIAADLLPIQYPAQNANDFGRATRGAALALKARMLLYAASPLFNDPQNSEATPWSGIYDPDKWKLAAQAAFDVMDMKHYSLFPVFRDFFITVNSSNREMIFNRTDDPHNWLERINGPTGLTGGMGATNPSLGLFNSFAMSDGTPFDWENPQHLANPYVNRDGRMAATILFNGTNWMGHTVETFQGGQDMQSVNSTKTGFYLRKFLDPEARWFGGQTGVANHCWPVLRYAEVLLNFAEAMNEAYGPYSDPEGFGTNAAQVLFQIRMRAQIFMPLPGDLTQDQMREIIRNERKVELAFEEHRPFDLRRWKIAMQVLNEPVQGLRIIRNADNTFSYQVIENVENRVFQQRMYLYPIPQSEIDKNAPYLLQNPGW